MAKSTIPPMTALEAWHAVNLDRRLESVVVIPEEAHLFEYPGFEALQLGLDDGVQFTHRGRTRVKMAELARLPISRY